MDEFEWNAAIEAQLLEAMIGHKPVGVNKYFQMACICDKLGDVSQKEISSEEIWQHLETMYNLEVLDEGETIPFPNNEKDFYLPDSDFAAYINKREEEKKSVQKGRETPKAIKEVVVKREDKTPSRNSKEILRRDSKDSKEKTPATVKKDVKKEPEKNNKSKGKNSSNIVKEETKSLKNNKTEDRETPKIVKRPTRGSLKPDDSSSSGKSSPVNVTPSGPKRMRRI